MSNPRDWNGNGWFIDDIVKDFDTGAKTMMQKLEEACAELAKSSDNPRVLAEFQAKFSEHTLFINTQSYTIKVFKDIGGAIIQNFR